MITYILKSSIYLVVMFGLYWFLLRQEKLFKFNRVFLIFSVLFSLSVPFISIPLSIGNHQTQESIITSLNSAFPIYSSEQNTISSTAYPVLTAKDPLPVTVKKRISYSQILIILYFAGVLILLFRFIRNIFFIYRQMKSSEKIIWSGQELFLTTNHINPFCFFNTIFVSKHDYLNNKIAEELISHEIEHIRQSHSIDVIFIELIKIIYWFNPVLILYSRAIRINHEYLADNGVIQETSDVKDYADKLVSFISSKLNVPLTSGFNPSLTRKRLIMLTKSRTGRINYGVRICVTFILASVTFLVLSIKPLYSHPDSPEQSINVFSDLKSNKVNDIDNSQEKTGKAEPAILLKQTKNNSEKSVKGFVVNKYGKYIEGLQIIVSGKKSGIRTDKMGHFTISNVPEDAMLTFSYEGYVTQTIKPVFTSEMVVRFIIENESALPKEKIISIYLPNFDTNPVIIIDSVPVERESMYNIDPSNKVSSLIVLKGKDATDKYGEKGKNGIIEIFTVGNTWGAAEKSRSESQKFEKLLIVDGVVSTKKLEDIPVENIEKLEVLGNVHSTNRYGELGKNGTIIITTKGKPYKPSRDLPEIRMEGVVAVTNMNVLYAGIPNPIEIAVPGITTDNVTVTSANGTVRRSEKGWEVIPLTFDDLVLNILAYNIKVDEKIFRVKPIPAPVAVFAGKVNGSLSKDAMSTVTLEAKLEDFLWDLKFAIESFTFAYSKDGFDIEITSKGNKLTDEMKSAISDLKSGQSIFVKDIKAIGPDNKIYDLSPIILKID